MRARRSIRTSLAFLALALLSGPVLSGRAAEAATIDVTGTVTAAGLSLGTVMAYNPFPIYPFSTLDGGAGGVTAFSGFSSFAGLNPSDLTITFGDLERLSTTFAGGCVPTPAANCSFATNNWGNADAGNPHFDISLAGTGAILSGTIQSWSTTTDTAYPGNPDFGLGTGAGSILFTGGFAPYLEEVLSLTGGTGVAQLGSDRFNAICSFGSDPCAFSLAARLTFVPEPSTTFLVGIGLGLLAARRERSQG